MMPGGGSVAAPDWAPAVPAVPASVAAVPASVAATPGSPAISVMAGKSPVLRSVGWYPDPAALEQRRPLPLGVQDVPVKEREHRFVPDPRVLRLRDPVVLVREVQELRVHA